MKSSLTIICQVSYKQAFLHASMYRIEQMPEFKGDFILPEACGGPIDCRILILSEENEIVSSSIFMAPASPKLISRMLNINILRCINSALQ